MWLALDDLDRFLNQLDPNMLVANLEGVVSQHQCRAHANHVDDIQRSEIEMQFIITQTTRALIIALDAIIAAAPSK